VLRNGCGGNDVFDAELCFPAAAIEIAFGAIPLNRTDGPGVASVIVALGRFVHGEGILAVVGGRDWSRLVVGHSLDDNLLVPTSRRVIPTSTVSRATGWQRLMEVRKDRRFR
jgi:hypothetical protein